MKHFVIIFFPLVGFLLNSCSIPITNFETISIQNEEDSLSYSEDAPNNLISNVHQIKSQSHLIPFLLYRECTKSGGAWLFICQSVGLRSLYQTILLTNPQIREIKNIKIFYYPKKSYLRFEMYGDFSHY
ncbi:hypothetical protein CQA53_05355 [Helicobacter didelphidarum]|uniref:Uncharacterized protein n=1 Tax=Helicobacter didelphidarum TaxID=2040648 RepID=A0A3D8IL01_9HELI|nr:hypothetical protein [Helicobacter didelphidarum]RDU65879.1 hypothetical protein CQA53_05355 [Helicobacter didelphidarum]